MNWLNSLMAKFLHIYISYQIFIYRLIMTGILLDTKIVVANAKYPACFLLELEGYGKEIEIKTTN